MSAWYILSALGIYPLDPVSGCYELGSPLVKGARLRLGFPYNTAVIEIRVKGYAPDRWRVKRVMLNGNELKDWRVSHADLVKGGVMEFEMDSLDNPCAKADSEPEGACPRLRAGQAAGTGSNGCAPTWQIVRLWTLAQMKAPMNRGMLNLAWR